MDFSFSLRPATEADFLEIKVLIRQVRINPMGLDWRRFTVAVEGSAPGPAEGPLRIIACGQLKPVPGGFTELASLAVQPPFRHRGVARAIIEHLLEKASPPIYLTCRSSLGTIYEKFGFRVLDAAETPLYYRRLQRLAGLMMELTRRNETLFVMKLG